MSSGHNPIKKDYLEKRIPFYESRRFHLSFQCCKEFQTMQKWFVVMRERGRKLKDFPFVGSAIQKHIKIHFGLGFVSKNTPSSLSWKMFRKINEVE